MINLRYHIVSLVAVFLALAIGILMGSTVLDRGTVALLEGSSTALRRNLESHRAENERLLAELEQWRAFGEQLRPSLVEGQLTNRHVVLVDTNQVDNVTRDAVAQVAGEAGATFAGRITIDLDQAVLEGDAERADVGDALDISDDEPDVLRRALVEELTRRLLTPAVLPQDEQDRPSDLLTNLRDLGLLADLDLPSNLDLSEPYPPAGTLFVVAGPSGEQDEPHELEPQELLVPLAGQLAEDSPEPVVAVERWAAGGASWLAALRGDDRVANRISSIDNVDQTPGQIALVATLAQQLAGESPGHYGAGAADGLLPERTFELLTEAAAAAAAAADVVSPEGASAAPLPDAEGTTTQ